MPRRARDGKDDETEVEIASRFSFNSLEKPMTPFTGDDVYGVENFIKEFEDVATLMKWSEIEKLIYSKRLLAGTAKLLLRSLSSTKSWVHLKEELQEEFGQKLNSATIHALIEYVVDGIQDIETNKAICMGL